MGFSDCECCKYRTAQSVAAVYNIFPRLSATTADTANTTATIATNAITSLYTVRYALQDIEATQVLELTAEDLQPDSVTLLNITAIGQLLAGRAQQACEYDLYTSASTAHCRAAVLCARVQAHAECSLQYDSQRSQQQTRSGSAALPSMHCSACMCNATEALMTSSRPERISVLQQQCKLQQLAAQLAA
eukprot:13097-Heterococcus_DN1.PRE.3